MTYNQSSSLKRPTPACTLALLLQFTIEGYFCPQLLHLCLIMHHSNDKEIAAILRRCTLLGIVSPLHVMLEFKKFKKKRMGTRRGAGGVFMGFGEMITSLG